MGLYCSCGVTTNPVSNTPSIQLRFEDGQIRNESLTFAANVCADTLESSTLTASFIDLSGIIQTRNFIFTSVDISQVKCRLSPNGECEVAMTGVGLIVNELIPRQFVIVFIDRPPPLSDCVESFFISGFVINTTPGDLQPDLIFFGCPTTP
jgi:hypothetical protein